MVIRKEDLADLDIVDSSELISDGYSIYLTTSVVSTNTVGSLITINLPADGEGLITGLDHPVQTGDRVWLIGTSGAAADGYYFVDSVISDTTFSILPPLNNSTGGTAYFMYISGSLNVGFDKQRYSAIDVTHNNVQEAIEDLDKNKISEFQHQTLRHLIHFIDEGPADGFASGAVKKVTPFGSLFPTSIVWYTDNTETKKIVKQTVVWSGIVPTTITWEVYNVDGITVAHTVSDSITYTNAIIEVSRTRTIS